MIEEATKNARAAAVKFAKDSDSELGKIKRAYQGQFSIEDRDANTPYIKRIRVVTTIDYSLEDKIPIWRSISNKASLFRGLDK